MKTKILFLITIWLLFFSGAYSQTIFTANTSPGSWDDGFSMGIGIEKQERLIYYGAEAYVFPQLNGIDYAHLIGRFGIAPKLDWQGNFKIIGGVRGGLIYRGEHLNYAQMGVEAGVQIRFLDNFYGIITGSIDNRTDSKYYSNVDYITVKSVWVKIGFEL